LCKYFITNHLLARLDHFIIAKEAIIRVPSIFLDL